MAHNFPRELIEVWKLEEFTVENTARTITPLIDFASGNGEMPMILITSSPPPTHMLSSE